MLFQFVGAAAVIVGTSGLGMYYAAREGFRANELLELKKALLILSSEIEYMRAPLNMACANIAKRTENTTATLFGEFALGLDTGEGETAYQVWLTAMAAIKEQSFLVEEDMTILDGFGKTLGYLDKHMQKNAIDFAIDYIDEKVTELQNKNSKNKRMYRSLGIICGLLISVILW